MKRKTNSLFLFVQRLIGRSEFLVVCLAFLFGAGLSGRTVFTQDAVVVVGSGSSVPAPLYDRWAQVYNKSNPRIQMRYVPIGTSEGIKELSRGNGDFGAGEVALTAAQRAEAKLIALPAVLIGIVPIYHLPGLHQELRFSGEVLAGIFLGEIKNWNDPQIAKINPNVSLPDLPIKVINRPAGKGTNYVLTEFLSKTSSKFKSRIGISPSPNWPVGTPAERSADMVNKVKTEMGAIGYVELQYAIKGDLSYGRVLNPAGTYVKASAETITAACRGVEAPAWDKFSASLTNAPGADSFPITSFTWLYLRATSADSRRAAALADLLNWMYTDGQQLGVQEGYPPLPAPLLAKVRAKANSLR